MAGGQAMGRAERLRESHARYGRRGAWRVAGDGPGRCWSCRRPVPLAVVAEADGGSRAGVCLCCILVSGALPALAQALPAATGLVLRQQPGYSLDAFAALLQDDQAAGGATRRALRCEGAGGARRYRWL